MINIFSQIAHAYFTWLAAWGTWRRQRQKPSSISTGVVQYRDPQETAQSPLERGQDSSRRDCLRGGQEHCARRASWVGSGRDWTWDPGRQRWEGSCLEKDNLAWKPLVFFACLPMLGIKVILTKSLVDYSKEDTNEGSVDAWVHWSEKVDFVVRNSFVGAFETKSIGSRVLIHDGN